MLHFGKDTGFKNEIDYFMYSINNIVEKDYPLFMLRIRLEQFTKAVKRLERLEGKHSNK